MNLYLNFHFEIFLIIFCKPLNWPFLTVISQLIMLKMTFPILYLGFTFLCKFFLILKINGGRIFDPRRAKLDSTTTININCRKNWHNFIGLRSTPRKFFSSNQEGGVGGTQVPPTEKKKNRQPEGLLMEIWCVVGGLGAEPPGRRSRR